jgi:hypothetical protein
MPSTGTQTDLLADTQAGETWLARLHESKSKLPGHTRDTESTIMMSWLVSSPTIIYCVNFGSSLVTTLSERTIRGCRNRGLGFHVAVLNIMQVVQIKCHETELYDHEEGHREHDAGLHGNACIVIEGPHIIRTSKSLSSFNLSSFCVRSHSFGPSGSCFRGLQIGPILKISNQQSNYGTRQILYHVGESARRARSQRIGEQQQAA